MVIKPAKCAAHNSSHIRHTDRRTEKQTIKGAVMRGVPENRVSMSPTN
jgi:hypothetical protein